jgi:hypothetical protein
MPRTSFHTLDAARAVEHVVLQLAAARRLGDRTSIPSVFAEASLDRVRLMPAWVVRAALLKSRGAWWLWCEPRRGARGAGQLVMEVPAGRYMVDILDTQAHAWFSRESASGGLLVAGLPATGRPVLVRVRRASSSTSGTRV